MSTKTNTVVYTHSTNWNFDVKSTYQKLYWNSKYYSVKRTTTYQKSKYVSPSQGVQVDTRLQVPQE